jgi:hypothetical protein
MNYTENIPKSAKENVLATLITKHLELHVVADAATGLIAFLFA